MVVWYTLLWGKKNLAKIAEHFVSFPTDSDMACKFGIRFFVFVFNKTMVHGCVVYIAVDFYIFLNLAKTAEYFVSFPTDGGKW